MVLKFMLERELLDYIPGVYCFINSGAPLLVRQNSAVDKLLKCYTEQERKQARF